MTMSLRVAPVSVVAPFDYTQIIWASLLGWIIWASVPTANTLAGAALISASGLYTALRERRLHLERLASPLPIE
jgi:drug/metabolite transporter (DMT)-like permease